MDIFLSSGARKALTAIAALAKKARPAGILLGHVRGGRYFIEDAVAGTDADWTAPETYQQLDAVYPGRIIGFFVFSRAAAERRRIGRPHACGRIVLTVAKRRDGGLDVPGYRIDYDGRFVFEKLDVIFEKEARP